MGLLGTLVGAAIDRRDGDSGIRGAVIGSVVQRVLTRSLPLGIGIVAALALHRRWRARSAPAYPADATPAGR